MYEQYTDKQIVEMLKPKLEKLGWGATVGHLERYPSTCKVIAVICRSTYIRGQLGRSFIIGEKNKQNGRWFLANKDNIKVGSKVRMINEEAHKDNPRWVPNVGTVGIVTDDDPRVPFIQWPSGTTSKDDRWFCSTYNLEVLLCE